MIGDYVTFNASVQTVQYGSDVKRFQLNNNNNNNDSDDNGIWL